MEKTSPPLVQEVYALLGHNRPSHRLRIKEIFGQENGPAIVGEGTQDILSNWIDGDWMDEGQIFYTGRMLAGIKDQPQLSDTFSVWVQPLIFKGEKARKVVAAFMDGAGLTPNP